MASIVMLLFSLVLPIKTSLSEAAVQGMIGIEEKMY